jgi:hypothetical protein
VSVLTVGVQSRGHQRAAENYYRQAIEVYDKTHGARRSASSSSSKMDEQIERDIAAVLFNYGQFLVHHQRWDDAERVLQRAQTAANAAGVPRDHIDRIERLLAMLDHASEDESQDRAEESTVEK